MKIHYSPSYDGDIFVNSGTARMGVSYVGTQGLLRQLQLRAGLHREEKPAVEREADYMLAMKENVGNTIFAKAFAVDEIGVAGKLLQWRDRLLMAGWNGECTADGLVKLTALASFEKEFHSCGAADFWAEVCRVYEDAKVLDDTIKEILVECPQNEISHLVGRTLAAIEKFGTTVTYMVARDGDSSYDAKNVKVLEFDDLSDAYEWIAQVQSLPQDTVVVNRDNVLLDHILYSWNRPQVQSAINNANPQLLQLFKLGVSIFSRPLNVANLISYLQLPISPIPAGLRYKLARILIGEGGFGDKELCADGARHDAWEQAIDSYEFLDNKGKDNRVEKMVFLAPVRKEYDGGVEKKELQDYLDALSKWINGKFADKSMSVEVSSQLQELRSFIASFKTSLDSFGDKVEYADIEKLVRQIYRPMNFASQCCEVGALNVIDDIAGMATPANTLIWLDCQDEEVESDPYEFLLSHEREYLKTQGVVIPDFALHLQDRRKEMLGKLSGVKNVILVRSAYNGTARLSEHSLIAEVRQILGKLPLADSCSLFEMLVTTREKGDVERLAPVKYVELGEIGYKGRKESNTSIDTLINYPFDYVMDYVAKLYEPEDAQPKELKVVIGLVAHYFFENIVADGGGDYNRMRQLTVDEFDDRLECAINAKGLALQLPENASQLNEFALKLKDSMLALVEIMEQLELVPVGCEVSVPQEGILELEGIGNFGAKIDFLLMTKEGKYMVLDFKWTYPKYYIEKLEKNKALQLELYTQAVAESTGKEVVAVGYYIMPYKQLLTCNLDELEDSALIRKIEPEPLPTPMSELVRNSYAFRMKEISQGHIEEAEMLDVKDDAECYYSRQEAERLFPLSMKETAHGRGRDRVVESVSKDSSYVFRNSGKFSFGGKEQPSEKATTHAILKGRLK